MLLVGADQQKILCYWAKYASFWWITYSLAMFSLGCRNTPWGDGPQLGTVL